jgi:surface antigen
MGKKTKKHEDNWLYYIKNCVYKNQNKAKKHNRGINI